MSAVCNKSSDSRPGARGIWPGLWWSAGIGVVHVEAWWTLRWLEGRIRC
jgi:hypothetical protein